MQTRNKSIPTLLSHVLAWMLVLCVLYLFHLLAANEIGRPMNNYRGIAMFPLIGLFYWNAYLLVPRYLMQRRKAAYLLLAILSAVATAALCAGLTMLYVYLGFDVAKSPFLWVMRSRMLLLILSMGVSAGFGIYRVIRRAEEAVKFREYEHMRTELSFLRSQVNPHFMLNTLNGMVALARKKSDQLEPALIELAGMMRYMLYDLDLDQVGLNEELDYLRSYINLQLLRFGHAVKVHMDVEVVPKEVSIEPMLLIPLVENAFTHGVGVVEGSTIEIRIEVDTAKRFSMTVRNKCPEPAIRGSESEKSGGIGLTNLKKRLTLTYPGRSALHTEQKESWFISMLNLQLS